MVNETVKYHNDLNTVPMRKWTKEEMDFFFSIISKLKEKGTREIEFDKYQLAELARYTVTHNKRFEETMERLVKNISQIHYIERTSNSLELMNLFSRFKVTWEDDLSDMTLVVKVTEEFNYVINKLQVEFTSWELEEFTSIRSTYAKTMYRLLKQWRTVGKVEYKVDVFKQLLDMPSYYTPSEIDKNVLQPILKELPSFFSNLKIKKIKSNKRGTPVIAYEFTFSPEKTGTFIDYKKKNQPRELTPEWLKNESQTNRSTDAWTEDELEREREKLRKELAELENAKQTKIDEYLK
ncbi:replication initiation protein [Macrococcoides caseolyticum]|uniref:Plasmid replication initiation protein n=1 Tax=Macrococcus caseolyticus (strain JCSC5402) TaxID=458233 RepID=B9ECF4_MACCJ|nr:replication initiation protein [Macrococcus caseolyticus]BAH18762.1 plasmid replication initiation protein [Macrococcus caseolyticus JCSC5402]